jgi:hypothetical protein
MDLRKERAPSVGKQEYVYRLTGAVKIITIREMAALVVSASLGDFSHFVWGFLYKLGTRGSSTWAALKFSPHRQPSNEEI